MFVLLLQPFLWDQKILKIQKIDKISFPINDLKQQAYKYIILMLKTENLFGLLMNILKMLSFS